MVSTTGIAGLTLGGGLGWLMAKHGLAADNLISAEVVTAAGDVVRASDDGDTDLFWGLRGGGGNFGVVSWFEYRSIQWGGSRAASSPIPSNARARCWKFCREITAGRPTS